MKPDSDSYLPLAPATLHILLAVAGEPMHGYGITQEVLRQSGGRYKLGPGTLYDNLQRLMKQRMVEEVAAPREEENSRRRYYRLSSLGREKAQLLLLSHMMARLGDVSRQRWVAQRLCESALLPVRPLGAVAPVPSPGVLGLYRYGGRWSGALVRAKEGAEVVNVATGSCVGWGHEVSG